MHNWVDWRIRLPNDCLGYRYCDCTECLRRFRYSFGYCVCDNKKKLITRINRNNSHLKLRLELATGTR